MESLQRLGVRGQSFAIELEVTLVHDHRAGIHGSRHRGSLRRGEPHGESPGPYSACIGMDGV